MRYTLIGAIAPIFPIITLIGNIAMILVAYICIETQSRHRVQRHPLNENLLQMNEAKKGYWII